MNKIILITTAVAVLFFSNCQNESNVSKENAGDEKIVQVYQSYLHIKDALVASNPEKAAIHARELAESAETEHYDQLSSIAADISITGDLEEQRAIFSDLSEVMIEELKSSGAKVGGAYLQFCPMAFDDRGANWISDKKEIRNPYFGDEMLKCGKVVETISQ